MKDEKIYLQCDLYVVADLFAFLDRERAIFVYISLALLMTLRENKTSVNRLTAFPVYWLAQSFGTSTRECNVLPKKTYKTRALSRSIDPMTKGLMIYAGHRDFSHFLD